MRPEETSLLYQYVILPGRPGPHFKHRDLYNRAYLFWKDYWQRTFRHKAPDFWDPNDFFRQDFIYCLFDGDVVVAQNLSTCAHRDHAITGDLEYFKSFAGEAMDVIDARQAKTLMSLEYTSVNSKYGERRTGVRFAEVMNGLALETFFERGFDATVGTPRRLSGLSQVGSSFGYTLVAEGYQKAGWELDVFVGFPDQLKKHPDDTYRRLIELLWQRRLNLTEDQARQSITNISSFDSKKTYLVKGAETMEQNRHLQSPNTREIYNRAMNELATKFDSFDWSNRYTYSLWLAQAYYLVRHTTRLLSLCAGYCPFEYEETHKRLAVHREEESGHDNIAVADLKALDASLSDLPELEETTKLLQLQYDQMKNISGCSFFGYILLLEGLAITRGREVAEQAAAAFGPRATRFLKTHAEDDVEHIEKAFHEIESFDPDDQQHVANNLRQSTDLYCAMLDHVARLSKEKESAGEMAHTSLSHSQPTVETSI